MERFAELVSHAVAIPVENIDTDQIIPARFLRVTHKDGLATAAFADWREQPDFVLNQAASQGAKILVAGDNFGCGSSREHAPWALWAWGFRAVISSRFADIFKNNALKNGLLPIVVDAETHRRLFEQLAADPDAAVTVDLAAQTLTLPDGARVTFPIDPFSRTCLLQGVDELGYLLSKEPQIAAFEARG